MQVITRFAPSPTGMLHIGNTRTALINYLYTRKNQGKFILRIDDTDLERSREHYTQSIKEDLSVMGLTWDSTFNQRSRISRYDEIKEQLLAKGRIYACYETPAELDIKRKQQLASGNPPIYDRRGLHLSASDRAEYERQGRRPHYRFLILDEEIAWQDIIKGHVAYLGKNLGDPIIIKEDGTMTYMLSSVIDDIDYNITHILRGEDHLTNTAVQVQMFKALSDTIPEFGHLSLLKLQDEKISKRVGGFDLHSILHQSAIEPMAISSFLVLMGTSKPLVPHHSLQSLVDDFDITCYSKNPIIYNPEQLIDLNHKLLLTAEFSYIQKRASGLGITITETFWQAVKANVRTINDLLVWHQVCYHPVLVKSEHPEILETAAQLLPEGECNIHTWETWTQNIQKHTNLKGKALFMPLRLALTGLERGPELATLIPIIGRQEVLKRLRTRG